MPAVQNNNNSGVVLARSRSGESSIKLTLFLKNQGIIYSLATGAVGGRTRFGGGTEPFVWGVFNFRQGKHNGLYLNNVDIVDDMIKLRRRPRALFMAIKWGRLITRHLVPANPDDSLLANLYWNMRLLCIDNIPVEVADWRFIWRWLMLWGIAPDIGEINKNAPDQELLIKIADTDVQDIIKTFNFNLKDLNLRFFQAASGHAENFLNLNSY